MNVQHYMTNDEFDEDLVFIGWAAEELNFKVTGTDKVRLTAEVTAARTIINNGTTDLYPGDRVAYITPKWNKYRLGLAGRGYRNFANTYGSQQKVPTTSYIKPDMEWLRKHSGHPKTRRIFPQLTKINSAFVSDVYRPMFVKLFNHVHDPSSAFHTSNRTGCSYFPTATLICQKNSGRMRRSAQDLSPMDILAISKYNDLMIASMLTIRECIRAGVLTGVSGANRPLTNPDERRKTIEKCAGIMGFYESEDFIDDSSDLKDREQTICIRNFLANYFAAYTTPDLKNILELQFTQEGKTPGSDDIGFERDFIHSIFEGTKIGQHVQNKILLNRLNKFVGTIIKGGKSGNVVDIDGRSTYSL